MFAVFSCWYTVLGLHVSGKQVHDGFVLMLMVVTEPPSPLCGCNLL